MFTLLLLILTIYISPAEQFSPPVFGITKYHDILGGVVAIPSTKKTNPKRKLCVSNASATTEEDSSSSASSSPKAEKTNNPNSPSLTTTPPPPRRKKKKIVINQNLVGVSNVSSDGLLTESKKEQKEAQKARENFKSNLGVASKKRMKDINNNSSKKKKLSKKAQMLADQRTANGMIDGKLQAGLALPEDQKIQIQELKRGNKQVTIVR